MRAFFLTTILCLFSSTGALASEQKLSFTIETSMEPISAVGLIVKTSGVVQKPNVEFSKISKGVWKATLELADDDIADGSFASVMLLSSEGDVATSDVRALSKENLDPIPQCESKDTIKIGADTQVGVLQSLVSVRTARRENARIRIREQMSGDLLETMRKLEIGFGLPGHPELSADLPPYELVDRLSRIDAALSNYRSGKLEQPQK